MYSSREFQSSLGTLHVWSVLALYLCGWFCAIIPPQSVALRPDATLEFPCAEHNCGCTAKTCTPRGCCCYPGKAGDHEEAQHEEDDLDMLALIGCQGGDSETHQKLKVAQSLPPVRLTLFPPTLLVLSTRLSSLIPAGVSSQPAVPPPRPSVPA